MKTRFERSRSEGCLSDMKLDAWFADELTEPALHAARAHLASCARCQARQRELAQARSDFLAARPPAFVKPAHEHARPQPARPRLVVRRVVPAVLLIASAAAAMLMLQPRDPHAPRERTKGSAQIDYYLKRGEHVVHGEAETRILPGDLVRLTYSCSEPCYLSVFGRDARAHVDQYFPAGKLAEKVQAGERRALPQAIDFDATPGPEQLFALFCSSALPLAPLRAELADRGQLSVPEGCSLDRLALEKASLEEKLLEKGTR